MSNKYQYSAHYVYEREGAETALMKKEYRDDAFAELDESVKESLIFKTKGEIGLLFDYNEKLPNQSVLLKHGIAASVENEWKRHKIIENFLVGKGSKLVFIKGQMSVIELNKMINVSGYVGTWYSNVISENLKNKGD